METFADYILSEEDWIKKMEIMYYLKQKTGIFYDKSVVFKTFLAKLFLENTDLGLDKNTVLTACLIFNWKKNETPQELGKVQSYAKEGAEYLSKLGVSRRFCKICEGVNRYSGSLPREKESDVLELVDQFGGMLLDRPERIAFQVDEALVLLEYRNLKNKNNRYLQNFKQFVNEMQEVLVCNQNVIQIGAKKINESNDTKESMQAMYILQKAIEAIERESKDIKKMMTISA